MARSTEEIQDEIINAKEAEPDLNGLDSTSQTAVWRLWTRITAGAMNLQEILWDALKKDIETIARTNNYGTAIWWRRIVQIFQYSSSDPQELIVDENFRPTYDPIDETLQIITRSAVRDDAGTVLIMVNKETGILTSNELTAFKEFVADIQPAGILTTTRSENPDVIKLTATIYFDRAIGESQTLANIEKSVQNYLETLNPRGELFFQGVVDAVQAAEGVVDVDPASVQLEERRADEAIANYQIVARVYDTYAGFATLETNTSHDLATTLTFVEYS